MVAGRFNLSELGGNPEALRAHKVASQRQTRQDLERALARLRNGNPRRVKKGTPITAASVAEEAGIDRSTLYRYHEPILTEIRKVNETTQKKRLQAKQGELAESQTRTREYRKALEEVQAEMNAWARQNYMLAHKVQELEALILERDTSIAELQSQLREARKTVQIRPISKPGGDD